uniref:RING-type domain-containing protein n=1 Tax=Caenorhabditis tropicalis TaxID=1561998 RepID=A0A1I7UT41_9PELO
MAETSAESSERTETDELLDKVSFLSLEFDDVQTTTNFLLKHAEKLEETDYCIEVFRRNCFGVVRNVEVDKKGGKRLIPTFMKSLQSLKSAERVVEGVYQMLLTLPILLQSRWDLLTMLASSKMISELDDVLFIEVMACAPDQDLSARCSSMVLQMSSNPKTYERAAEIIYRGLTSPVFAVRSNVLRSWLSRVINIKSTQKCIEKLLELCQNEVRENKAKMWPVSFREVTGLTCVDLEWKAVLDEEPYDVYTFSLLAYFTVLLTLKNSGSQVRVQLKNDDEVVQKGIEYFGAIAAKQAFAVCSKYKIYPQGLEKAVICELGTSSRHQEIFDIVDDDMMKTFTKEAQMLITKQKLKFILTEQKFQEEQRKAEQNAEPKQEKSYPVEDDGSLQVEVNLRTELSAQLTLERFLEVQHPTEEYPSVAAVMERLHTLNIDERFFCQEVNVMNDKIQNRYSNRVYGRKTYTELVFTMITRIPLRAVVDHVGATIKEESKKDVLFREKIFRMACELMESPDENARPLSLYHCFIATCDKNSDMVADVWDIVKSLKSGPKMKKMAEMLAKVVTCSEITVDNDTLHDMILCSLGLHHNQFDGESPQLFVAAVSKLLDFRNESERIMLFTAIAESPEVLEVIKNILLHKTNYFTDSAFQMVLFFFTRFHVGAYEFYPEEHLLTIAHIINFCHWSIRKFAGEKMMLSMAVDAILGFLPWDWTREKALLKEGEYDDLEDPVEKLIIQNMRHHRLCVLLAEHNKPTKIMTIEDFEDLPKAKFIVEVIKRKDLGPEPLNALAKELAALVKTATAFEDVHAVWLAYGILSDKALEMIDEAEQYKDTDPNYKSRYPSRTLMDSLVDVGAGFSTSVVDLRMANSWLDKGLGKIQILTDREFCLDDCPP